MEKIVVVLPLFNEEHSVIPLLHELESCIAESIAFVLVDDGSTDATSELIKAYVPRKGNTKRLVSHTRNFGHHHAIMTGLAMIPCPYDAVIVMDADFQDDPRAIKLLLDKLREGFDCVYAVRSAKSGSILINFATRIFYRLQSLLLPFAIPQNAGTFCAMKSRIIEQILTFKEVEVYFPGIRAYVGMKQASVSIERHRRRFGLSRVGLGGLIRLAFEGLLGFSAVPMRAILIIGGCITILCGVLGTLVIVLRITGVIQVLGFTSLAIFTLGLHGITIMFVGILGEYIGRVFIESKSRPRSLVYEVIDD